MEEVQEKFQYKLTQTLILYHLDFNKPFILYTNASKEGIGAVLCQKDEDVRADYVIQYYN